MYTTKRTIKFSKLLIGVLIFTVLLSACTLAEETPTTPTENVTAPETEDPIAEQSAGISLDTSDIAVGFITTEIPAAAPDVTPYWDKLPEHTVISFDGYMFSDSKLEPRIYIFPVDELKAYNEANIENIASLQALLDSPYKVAEMPFLPLVNETQMMYTQVQALDFMSGSGLRYLTEYSQGIVPVNNRELFYTYQGISSDGKYYVAAILPVSHPSLPTNDAITGNEPPEFSSDYLGYLASVKDALNAEPANSFSPDLAQLDKMMRSLEIK